MTTHHRRAARLVVAGSTAAVLLGSFAAGVPAGGSPGSVRAPASAGGWTQISSGTNHLTLIQPSVARFGSTYEVAWIQQVATSPSRFDLDARILNAAGKPLGNIIPVVTNWSQLQGDPTILGWNGERVIAFAGARTGGSDPYDTDAEYYATSSNGTVWSLSGQVLSPAGADRDTGTAVAAYGNSHLLTGLAENDRVDYYLGPTATNPPPSFTGSTDFTGNISYYPGVAVAGSDAWLGWWSNNNNLGYAGINVQQVLPSKGSRMHAAASDDSTWGAPGPHQDISLAERTGATSPYVAFIEPVKASSNSYVALWRAGAATPVARLHAPGVFAVVVAAAPHGRLWLYWWDTKGWHATRSNRAATRFGPASSLKLPTNAAVGDIAAAGSAGPLEAITVQATYQSGNGEVFEHQFLPRLSCSASPRPVRPGHAFTVRVVDAGDPVKGATVSALGNQKKTNSKGTVKFTVPSHHTSAIPVQAHTSGYAGCGLRERVKHS